MTLTYSNQHGNNSVTYEDSVSRFPKELAEMIAKDIFPKDVELLWDITISVHIYEWIVFYNMKDVPHPGEKWGEQVEILLHYDKNTGIADIKKAVRQKGRGFFTTWKRTTVLDEVKSEYDVSTYM